MIKWIKIEAGEYKSEDGRFHILKTYDRIYGDHWVLHDFYESDWYIGKYDEKTLRDCKLKAETIVSIK